MIKYLTRTFEQNQKKCFDFPLEGKGTFLKRGQLYYEVPGNLKFFVRSFLPQHWA